MRVPSERDALNRASSNPPLPPHDRYDPMLGVCDDVITYMLEFLPPKFRWYLISVSKEMTKLIAQREVVWVALSKMNRRWVIPQRMRKSWCLFYFQNLKSFNDKRMAKSNELLLKAHETLFSSDGLGAIKTLVKKGEEEFDFDADYVSASVLERNGLLNIAVIEGRYKVSKWLIEEKECWVETRDRGGFTPLLNAAYNGDLKMIKYLLRCGVNRRRLGLNHSSQPMLLRSEVYQGYDAVGWARKRGFEEAANVIFRGI